LIIEFTTQSDAKFRLDKDRMTWERTIGKDKMKGKLKYWPAMIKVGEPVCLIQPVDGTGGIKITHTCNVTEMKGIVPVPVEEVQ
jgi:hypothetical protein